MQTMPTVPPQPSMRLSAQEPVASDQEQQRREQAIRRIQDKTAFRLHLAAYLLVSAGFIATWALTGAGYFWPIFAILGWGAGVLVHGYCVYGGGNKNAFWLHLAAYVVINAGFVVAWATTEAGYFFWPIVVILAWGVGVAIHGYTAYGGGATSEAQIERQMNRLP